MQSQSVECWCARLKKRALLDAEVVHLVATAAPARLVRLEGQVLTKVLPIVEIQTLPKHS